MKINGSRGNGGIDAQQKSKLQQSQLNPGMSNSVNKEIGKQESQATRSNAMAFMSLDSGKVREGKNQVVIPNLFNSSPTAYTTKNKSFPTYIDVNSRFADDKKHTELTLININEMPNGSKIRKVSHPIDAFKVRNAETPIAQFKVGKFDPTVELIDKQIGIKVKMLPGSIAEADNFGIKMPGDVKTKGRETKNIAFTGHGEMQVVTYHLEPATKESVDMYQDGKFANKVDQGDYVEAIKEDQPTFMVLAGGFGTRLFDHTGESLNKPAAKIPTTPQYRLMGNALDKAAAAGVMDGKEDKVKYLSGADTISGDNVAKVLQDQDLGDGGCIAKSVRLGETRRDKPLVVLNADTITNADITRSYKAFHDHKDAAVLIPYYAVPENRASSFGLISAQQIEGDNASEIKTFVEKPANPAEKAKGARVPGTDNYMANPGIYLLSPEAINVLEKKGYEKLDNGKMAGLAKDIITPIVEMCQKGELKKADGTPMKVYTVPLEAQGGHKAYWDDLGKVGALVNTTRNMAAETLEHGAKSPENLFYGMPEFLLNDAVKNSDLDTGVVYMSDDAKGKLDQFKEKYNIDNLEGNVLVYDNCVEDIE